MVQPVSNVTFVSSVGNRSGDKSWCRCHLEAAISSVVKDYDQRWDLSKGMEIDADGSAVLRSKHYDTVKDMCQSDRMPPMSPSKVEQLLTTEKVFTSKADANIVANIYKTFFDIVSSSMKTLELGAQCAHFSQKRRTACPDLSWPSEERSHF